MNEAFEKKRQELLRQISQLKTKQKPKKKVEFQNYSSESQNAPTIKFKVAIFGKPSLFLKSLTDLAEARFQVSTFSTTTETIDTCAESGILNVLIDIDEPTGPKPAIEIIGNLKAVQPDTTFICFTKDITSKDSLVMEQKGAILISKPINVPMLLKKITR